MVFLWPLVLPITVYGNWSHKTIQSTNPWEIQRENERIKKENKELERQIRELEQQLDKET